MSLVPTIKLSMEMTDVLCDIERSGLKINLDTLDQIEDQYRQELLILEGELRDLAQEAMGDTPVNLNSPDDKSSCSTHGPFLTRAHGRASSI